uniref:Uncharacterized protein n=1 Tax=Rhizophagus irregularis (strain DAOM 181602 / DAOM 197198 / MUCL 43194) TaxID=747089 RepID=U9TT65_RHIID
MARLLSLSNNKPWLLRITVWRHLVTTPSSIFRHPNFVVVLKRDQRILARVIKE